jgi:hypothetical protein
MPSDVDPLSLFSLAAINTLRLEALDLFDRCLAEGKTAPLEAFIERQIAQEPPPLELLSQIAEDVHGRLMALRQNHFDVRDGVLRRLNRDFGVDLTPLVPADTLQDYHLLSPDQALRFLSGQNSCLSDDDRARLRVTLQTSVDTATRLHRDVVLAEYLYTYVMDWLMGLHVLSIRVAWVNTSTDCDGRKLQ